MSRPPRLPQQHGHDQHGSSHSHAPMPVTDADWQKRYSPEPVWSGHPNAALVAEVDDLPPGTAVDVGCGEGADAVWLAGKGWQVTAFDVADAALERGREAATAAGVEVDFKLGGLLNVELPAESFDLVITCYPALLRSPERLAETELLGLVAPGGRLLMLAHADIDREQAIEHGFDPDDYLDPSDLLAAAETGWTVERNEQRPRTINSGAGAGHHADLILLLRREGS